MLTKVTRSVVAVVALILFSKSAATQTKPTTLSSGLSRLAGTEETQHIEYVRLFLDGTLQAKPNGVISPVSPSSGDSTLPSNVSAIPTLTPVLIAQCTRRANGKMYFEILANFGGVDDFTYYPPWKPANRDDLFPPDTNKLSFTMEFLGYTHVKPVKRQWEQLLQPSGQYRYNTPGGSSSNMEDITYYLRFMNVLPTLHLTLASRTAEFRTTPLLEQIRKEPLCKASLL